jgi:protein gp37
MAASVDGDVLTGDWNPLIGCERYSAGCKNCWFLDFMFPWQQRLGNIPSTANPHESTVFREPMVGSKGQIKPRLNKETLRPKKGIVGVVQHGDLFWDKVATSDITKVLEIVDNTFYSKDDSKTKYVLWTKRIERAKEILNRRYPTGMPSYLAIACSIENQETANNRLPHLVQIKGTRIIVAEPILDEISILEWVKDVQWVIVGSETTDKPAKIPNITICNTNWIRTMRDETPRNIPFFIKQMGTKHGVGRVLDGRTWDEFPKGFVK